MSSIGFRMGFTGRAVLAGGAMGMGFVAGAAQATVYNWTYQEQSFFGNWTASGQFEETGGLITSFSGTWDGVTIDALLGVGALFGNDNQFPLTSNGVAFSVTSPLPDGGTEVVLFNDGFGFYWFSTTEFDYGNGSFTATAVPEPASAALLGTAVAGLLAGARRRRMKAAA